MIKFTQLYWFKDTLHALDEDGQVWYFNLTTSTWVELPRAARAKPLEAPSFGIVKPLTPEQIKQRNFKLAQEAIDRDIKDNEHK